MTKLQQPWTLAITVAISLTVLSRGVSDDNDSPWRVRNSAVVKQYDLKTRDRKIPDTDIVLKQRPGQVYEATDLPVINIAPGVTATVAWGQGAMLELVEMKPQADYPAESLVGEAITLVQEGSATCTANGQKLQLEEDEFVFLTAGMKRSLKAGPQGLKAIEAFSPVRVDHLRLAGVELPADAKVSFPDQGITKTSVEPAKVYNLNEVQWTGITPPDPSNSYKRSTAHSRLIWGKNMMLSFVRMDPNGEFPLHIHPEDQLMIALRGELVEGIMDFAYAMSGQRRDVVLQPGGMAHSAKLSEYGAEALDVFWPVRPDYIELATKQNELFRQVIAPGTKPVKLAEGFTFAEGPTWLNGALYFSDMYFRDHKNGDWTGSPQQSRLIRMEPNGQFQVLASGMQNNGTIASKNGNLLVCDMFGHRVVEMDPNSGTILRVALDLVGGKPIDGPNDLVMDAKGGFYVSDPQFTPEENKSQPGKQVYYVAADGTAKVVIPPGQYAMPNGVEISPDGNTFYVNNTWFRPGENFIWAYDINDDGSLTNRRKFAMLNLTPEVLSAVDPEQRFDSRADGMAVDEDGRIYVCTLSGVQIFDRTGTYVGTIWCPQYPVSCTFFQNRLYMVGESSVWAIDTKVKGFRLPYGLN
jgi:gluconolactonase